MPALLYSEKSGFCRKIRLQKPDLLHYLEFHTIYLRCQGNLRHSRTYPEKSGDIILINKPAGAYLLAAQAWARSSASSALWSDGRIPCASARENHFKASP